MIKLSVLIPAVYDRGYSPVLKHLTEQADGKPVEILTLYDNRKRSTGLKRQALLNAAQGRYIACLDDDDGVAPFYVHELLNAIETSPDVDVVVFNSQSVLNGENPFIVRTGLEFDNEPVRKDPTTQLWVDIERKPWHWCAWNARLAKAATFPDGYIDDDWYWLRQMIPLAKTQHRIDKTLHFYAFNSRTTLSQQGKSTL